MRRGQIIKRADNVWLVHPPIGRDASGRRLLLQQKRSTAGAKTPSASSPAKQREHDLGTFITESKYTVNECLDHWLASAAKARVRARTVETYEWLLDHYNRPTLGLQH